MGRNSYLKKSVLTGLETEANQELVSYYESELKKFKSEV